MILQKIIIWLFEKYAFDYWVDIQNETEKQRIIKENNLEDEEDFIQFCNDRSQEPLKEAYDAGRDDGYNKAMEERSF